MNRTRSTYIFLVVIAMICAIAVIYRSYLKQEDSPAQSTSQPTPKPVIITQDSVPPEATTDDKPPAQKKPLTPEEMMDRRNRGVSAFDTKLLFWGKVVDQDGKPVEGASIKAIATTLRMIKVAGGYREYEILSAKSSADGSFKFDGAEGFSLTIRELSKEGYVLPSAYQAGTRWEGDRYVYRYKSIGNQQKVFAPDAAKPVIFHLWKLKKPEPVAIIDVRRSAPSIRVGGPPTSIFFEKFTVSDVGSPKNPQWEVTVSALEDDGEVIKAEPNDIFMFQAPESGYTQSIKFRYGPEGSDAIKGEEGVPIRFYVRSRGGRSHSAEDFAIFAPTHSGKVNVKIRSWTNPNGSRNLEHDAAHPLDEPSLK